MNWRYRFTFFLFILFFILIILRLGYWQIVRADELSAMGQEQYGSVISLTPQRGQIESSDGFPIAADKLDFLVFADPKEVEKVDQTATLLSPILKIPQASLSGELSLNGLWVPIKSQVNADTKKTIENLDLPGIGFEEQTVRFYPEASMAATLLGFVGKDENGNDKGYFGLEGYYDRQLAGKQGIAVEIHDAYGRPILTNMNASVNKVDGRTLVLHVDRTVQFMLDQDLKESIAEYGASGGTGAIMDPKTGAILALSSFPSFDPSNYQEFSDNDYLNPFITSTYEPGSTFKPLIMSAALDSGVVTPDTKCSICTGPVPIGGYYIHTWDDVYHPDSTMTQVIQNSDNTGMVFVGEKLGLTRMLSYLNKFGIGQMSGIDLQGEEAPNLPALDKWYPIDAATAAFGQGIAVTPIELLDAVSAIANGGKRMQPQVVSQIITPDGQTITIPPKVVDQPISPQTAQVMTEIMVNAVDKGEASFARIKGYRIAGKTGTASIPVSGHYDPTQTIASFVGFAPADNPKFTMLIIINRPTASIWGSETAAPVFFRVAKNLLEYYGIPPTE